MIQTQSFWQAILTKSPVILTDLHHGICQWSSQVRLWESMNNEWWSRIKKEKNGGGGIRTPGDSRHAGFQDQCNRPLCHPSMCWLGALPTFIRIVREMFLGKGHWAVTPFPWYFPFGQLVKNTLTSSESSSWSFVRAERHKSDNR